MQFHDTKLKTLHDGHVVAVVIHQSYYHQCGYYHTASYAFPDNFVDEDAIMVEAPSEISPDELFLPDTKSSEIGSDQIPSKPTKSSVAAPESREKRHEIARSCKEKANCGVAM